MLRGAGAVTAALWLFFPLTWLVSLLSGAFFRVIRRPPRAIFPSREEVAPRARDRGRGDSGRKRVEAMLGSVFHFSMTSAREVMIPLPDVVAVEESAPTEELLETVRREGHTRIPIFQERVDQVIGFVNVFDILHDPSPRSGVRDYLRPIPITPDSKRIDRLMVELQRQREPLAVVVNEFGTCVGIVSLEDIIEEIMGEITDEHEETERRIRMVSPGLYHVDAKTDMDDLNEELELDLPKEGYDTLGGLMLKRFGRIPKPGDSTVVRGVRFEVLEVYRYGVRRVKVTLGAGGEAET
jgi:CBS domain containing-hemolysin-like protein